MLRILDILNESNSIARVNEFAKSFSIVDTETFADERAYILCVTLKNTLKKYEKKPIKSKYRKTSAEFCFPSCKEFEFF